MTPTPTLLGRAALALHDQGTPVPCETDSELWFAGDRIGRSVAARRCQRCPLLRPCREIGRGQRWGVWGGLDRGPREKHPTGGVMTDGQQQDQTPDEPAEEDYPFVSFGEFRERQAENARHTWTRDPAFDAGPWPQPKPWDE